MGLQTNQTHQRHEQRRGCREYRGIGRANCRRRSDLNRGDGTSQHQGGTNNLEVIGEGEE